VSNGVVVLIGLWMVRFESQETADRATQAYARALTPRELGERRPATLKITGRAQASQRRGETVWGRLDEKGTIWLYMPSETVDDAVISWWPPRRMGHKKGHKKPSGDSA